MTTASTPSLPALGIQRLLEHLIDYAGLFPPAQLDMETAVANYASYVAGPRHWMLERMIVPVSRLDEFEAAAAGMLPTGEDDEPWALSVLVSPADSDTLEADFERINAFNAAHCEPGQGLAIIDVVELKADDSSAIDAALDLVPDNVFPFFEIPASNDPRGFVATLVGGEAGAKIRTGGVTADLYPSVADVARFIAACASADVPFKATAGLHHPLRHFSEAVDCDEHGFLNVFVASVLASYHLLEPEEIATILEARTLDQFVMTHEGVGFGNWMVGPDDIEDARLSFAISYGSCSFDEPHADLVSLGVLGS